MGKEPGGSRQGSQEKEKNIQVLTTSSYPPMGQVTCPLPDLGELDPDLFREPPNSRQAMAFFMSVPPKMDGAMLLEMTSYTLGRAARRRNSSSSCGLTAPAKLRPGRAGRSAM